MKTDIIKKIKHGLIGVIVPAVFFYLLEFYTQNPFVKVRPWAQFFNILLFEMIGWFLFFLTGKLKRAFRILGVITMIFGIANAYVVRFRTNPIVPWDFFSLKTAVSVADNYDFMPSVRMVVVSLIFLGVLVLLRYLDFELGWKKWWKRLIPAAAFVVALGLFVNTLWQEDFQNSHRLYNKLFTPVYMTEVDGIALTFTMNMAYMTVEKPTKYSTEEARALLEDYGTAEEGKTEAADGESEANVSESEKLPNIIVVMNESFSDLAVLGDFKVNADYMPYLHSLQRGAKNTVTGMLNVSVCGGNTANTEFEFLTGNTMAFLPQGSIPYQQYINETIPSLAEYLAELGYQTVATHPYYASGWDRNVVYPWLGFSDSIFLDGYRTASDVRSYVSDESCVDKLIELYENKQEDQPLFAFQVTMQNHGGYQDAYANFTPDIKVMGVDNFSLEQYLSLVRLSDKSLERLIAYFSSVDEKTVVVFFGDHQPSDAVAYSILAMNGMSWNALDEEELKLRYQVPYVIWANYDIEGEKNADTSVNYLAAEVLQRAGVPTNEYQNFLLELKKEYPVISAVRTVKADGSEKPASEEEGEMEIYRKLQYYELFDRGGME